MPPTKTCDHCGQVFEKRRRMGKTRWESQRYCSRRCLRAGWGARRAAARRERVAAAEAAAALASRPELVDVVGYLPLHTRDGTVSAWAKVDGGPDFIRAAVHRWYLGSRGYPMRQERNGDATEAHFLHHLVLPEAEGREIDHANRDKLDNRQANLRALTHAENEQNKAGCRAASGVRNVYFDRRSGKYFARVVLNGRQHVRGYFATPEAAAPAARELRRQLHPFAPDDDPRLDEPTAPHDRLYAGVNGGTS